MNFIHFKTWHIEDALITKASKPPSESAQCRDKLVSRNAVLRAFPKEAAVSLGTRLWLSFPGIVNSIHIYFLLNFYCHKWSSITMVCLPPRTRCPWEERAGLASKGLWSSHSGLGAVQASGRKVPICAFVLRDLAVQLKAFKRQQLSSPWGLPTQLPPSLTALPALPPPKNGVRGGRWGVQPRELLGGCLVVFLGHQDDSPFTSL